MGGAGSRTIIARLRRSPQALPRRVPALSYNCKMEQWRDPRLPIWIAGWVNRSSLGGRVCGPSTIPSDSIALAFVCNLRYHYHIGYQSSRIRSSFAKLSSMKRCNAADPSSQSGTVLELVGGVRLTEYCYRSSGEVYNCFTPTLVHKALALSMILYPLKKVLKKDSLAIQKPSSSSILSRTIRPSRHCHFAS